jgi:hypothetical protein
VGGIGTWLDGKIVVALICFAVLFSWSGEVIRSLLATMYQYGLVRQGRRGNLRGEDGALKLRAVQLQ